MAALPASADTSGRFLRQASRATSLSAPLASAPLAAGSAFAGAAAAGFASGSLVAFAGGGVEVTPASAEAASMGAAASGGGGGGGSGGGGGATGTGAGSGSIGGRTSIPITNTAPAVSMAATTPAGLSAPRAGVRRRVGGGGLGGGMALPGAPAGCSLRPAVCAQSRRLRGYTIVLSKDNLRK